MEAIQAVMEASSEKMEATLRTSQDQRRGLEKVTVSGMQEKTESLINSNQSELEETIKQWVEGILVSVNQWTWSLYEGLTKKIEQTQSSLQAVTTSLNHIQVEAQRMKILVETMQHGLEARIAEVTQDFAQDFLNIVIC
jgi:hypothetical protein